MQKKELWKVLINDLKSDEEKITKNDEHDMLVIQLKNYLDLKNKTYDGLNELDQDNYDFESLLTDLHKIYGVKNEDEQFFDYLFAKVGKIWILDKKVKQIFKQMQEEMESF